jgi:hypothetical protein
MDCVKRGGRLQEGALGRMRGSLQGSAANRIKPLGREPSLGRNVRASWGAAVLCPYKIRV